MPRAVILASHGVGWHFDILLLGALSVDWVNCIDKARVRWRGLPARRSRGWKRIREVMIGPAILLRHVVRVAGSTSLVLLGLFSLWLAAYAWKVALVENVWSRVCFGSGSGRRARHTTHARHDRARNFGVLHVKKIQADATSNGTINIGWRHRGEVLLLQGHVGQMMHGHGHHGSLSFKVGNTDARALAFFNMTEQSCAFEKDFSASTALDVLLHGMHLVHLSISPDKSSSHLPGFHGVCTLPRS